MFAFAGEKGRTEGILSCRETVVPFAVNRASKMVLRIPVVTLAKTECQSHHKTESFTILSLAKKGGDNVLLLIVTPGNSRNRSFETVTALPVGYPDALGVSVRTVHPELSILVSGVVPSSGCEGICRNCRAASVTVKEPYQHTNETAVSMVRTQLCSRELFHVLGQHCSTDYGITFRCCIQVRRVSL